METIRQTPRPAAVPQLLEAIRPKIPNPLRFGLHLVLASTPLLAISGAVFGVVSLRAVAALFLLPLLGILAALVIFKPTGIDRTALAGFAWGLVACAGYDLFRLPTIYVFHLWGDFFGGIGGWATGTSSNYLAGYLWRYLGDGAGIGVVVFLLAQAACRRVHRGLRRLSRMGRPGAHRRARPSRASVVPAQRDDACIEPGRAPDLRGDPGLRAVGMARPCPTRSVTRGRDLVRSSQAGRTGRNNTTGHPRAAHPVNLR